MGKALLFSLAFLVIVHICLSQWQLRKGRHRRPDSDKVTDTDRPWARRGHRQPHRHHRRHMFEFDFGFDVGSLFSFDVQWSNSWWDGPNVCFTKSEKVDDDAAHLGVSSVFYHETHETFKISKTRMTRRGLVTTTEIYECCDGYTREEKEFGCPTETPLYSLPEVLMNLELTEFMTLINSTGLDNDVLNTENTKLTLFVPTNEAMKAYLPLVSVRSGSEYIKDMPSVVIVSQEISESVVDDARNLLLGHVVVGRTTSSHFENDQLLETASPHKTSIRMNSYSGLGKKVITANCQRVTSVDNMATNGAIHVVENVLKPVTDTLLDLIKKNPELSTLKTALGSSRMGSILKDEGSLYTILAPTDAAFRKHEHLLRKITSNPDCMENVLKNHIIPITMCSAAISGHIQVRNLLHKRLDMSRDDDDKVYVEGAQIVTTDLVATNGVLYIIDDVLIPDEALDILQLAEKNNLTEFGKLIDIAGMKKELRSAENVTVFIPSNEAIEALPYDLRSTLTKDDQALRDVLQYHIVPEVIDRRRQMYNNYKLDSLEGSKLRINEYSEVMLGFQWTQTVQCAHIRKTDYKGCDSAVYVIDRVLVPPAGNVVDVLARDKRFSTLVELLKMSQLADTLQEAGLYTVFAPTNEAFKSLGTDAVEELKDNPRTLKSVLMNHVTRDSVCCAGITRPGIFVTQKVRTLSGSVFDIGKRFDGAYYLGNADVTQCDVMATNGVVHVIDDVITGRKARPTLWGQYRSDHVPGFY